MKLFEKKQLITTLQKDRSIKVEWVPESKLKEWEENNLAELITKALQNPPMDRRKKEYVKWIEALNYAWSRYQELKKEKSK